jgi:hypothetical protein
MTDKRKTQNKEAQQTYRDKRKKIEAQWAVILEAIKELERLKG